MLLESHPVVSGWVKTELSAVESVKVTRSGLVRIVCASPGKREQVLNVKQMGTRHVNGFALKKNMPLKGVITGVVVNVKVDQRKRKSVCDARHLVQRRQGGMSGETEESSVLLS